MKTAASTTQTGRVRDAARDQSAELQLSAQQRRAVVDTQQAWHRLALHLLQSDELPRRMALGITSAVRGEGKTTSSIGLAAALARETGEPVLVVDADFQHPGLAPSCRLAPTPGLSDYLLERTPLESAYRPTPLGNLTAIVAGESGRTAADPPAEHLAIVLRRKMPHLLAAWKDKFSHIILDLPGILANVNTEQMARQLDGAMLVVRSGVTPLEKIQEAAGLLEGVHLIGAIHIGQPSALPHWVDRLLAE